MTETIWPYGFSSGYHAASCQCPRHCGYCFDDLPAIRALRKRLAIEGRGADFPPLHPLARYCCAHCKYMAKRERALDRWMSSVAPGTSHD